MKKFIATLAIALSVFSVALAGDIPGNGPTPPCTENCLRAEEVRLSAEPILPTADLPVSVVDMVSGIFALVF